MNNPELEINEEIQVEDLTETAETEQHEGEHDEDGEEELQTVYDIDGEEVDLDTIKTWKSGHLMQADYTKKTQAVSVEQKAVLAKSEALSLKIDELTNMEGEIESLIMGDLKDIDLDDLAERNPSEYLKVQRRMQDRQGKLSEIKNNLAQMQNESYADGYKQLSTSLGWGDSNKEKADKALIMEAVKSGGVTDKEFAKLTSPGLMKLVLGGARYEKLKKSDPGKTKKVKAAPKVTTPKAKSATPKPLSLAERMYGNKP